MHDDVCQTHSAYSVFGTCSETVVVNRFLFLIKSMVYCFYVNKIETLNRCMQGIVSGLSSSSKHENGLPTT